LSHGNPGPRDHHRFHQVLGTSKAYLQRSLGSSSVGPFRGNLPESRSALTPDLLLFVFLLAVLANVCYCAAYLVDIFAQASGLREEWIRFRWILLLVGIAFAGILTHFFAYSLFLPRYSGG
jgi:hypothetical protein